MLIKITDVESICLRVPDLDKECEWGDDAFIVRVHTDCGIIGIGESDTSPTVAKAMIEAPQSHLSCSGLKRLLIGENPLEIRKLWDKMYSLSNYVGRRSLAIHAMSAIDIALWDIASQFYNVPIHVLLGGKYCDKISAYATFITGETPEETADMALDLQSKGFTSLKFGGGCLGDDSKRDIEHVKNAREVLGEDFKLSIDLAGKWCTYSKTIDMIKALEPYNLNWIEEPMLTDDFHGYRRLNSISSTKIAAGESLTTRHEFKDFLDKAKPDIIQPDITRCGGISEMCKINDIASLNGVKLIPHGFSTGILLAATMQFLAATEYCDTIEYSQSNSPLFRELTYPKPIFTNGYLVVDDCIGLGISLNEDLIDKYKIKD